MIETTACGKTLNMVDTTRRILVPLSNQTFNTSVFSMNMFRAKGRVECLTTEWNQYTYGKHKIGRKK